MTHAASYDDWCRQHDCDHAHCPDACEHPQPFLAGGNLLCGRCWFRFGEAVEMLACRPEVCEGRATP